MAEREKGRIVLGEWKAHPKKEKDQADRQKENSKTRVQEKGMSGEKEGGHCKGKGGGKAPGKKKR